MHVDWNSQTQSSMQINARKKTDCNSLCKYSKSFTFNSVEVYLYEEAVLQGWDALAVNESLWGEEELNELSGGDVHGGSRAWDGHSLLKQQSFDINCLIYL